MLTSRSPLSVAALADGTQATITFDKPECLGKKAEITFAPK